MRMVSTRTHDGGLERRASGMSGPEGGGRGRNAKGRNGFLKLFSMIFIEISVYRMYA